MISMVMLNAQVTITSVSSTNGQIGDPIIITGTGFSTTPANNTVYIGYVKATVISATTTSLTVTAPSSAAGTIMVNANGTTATSTATFYPQLTSQDIDANLWGQNVDYYNGVSSSSYGYFNIETADFNGDGLPDIAAIDDNTNIKIFKNNGTPNNIDFSMDLQITVSCSNFTIGDFNGDGKIDIVVKTIDANPVVYVYLNTSTLTTISFDTPIMIAGMTSGWSGSTNRPALTTGDYNGDGFDDIFIGGWNEYWIIKNNFDGTTVSFSTSNKISISVGGIFNSFTSADIDNDGKIDVVATWWNSGGEFRYFKNTTSGGVISFAGASLDATGNRPSCITIGDLDNDGLSDLVFGNGYGVVIYRNNNSVAGTPSFDAKTEINTGGIYQHDYQIKLADINSDGKTDIIFANGQIRIIPNNSTPGSLSFGSVISKTGNTAYDFVILDVNNDGKLDCMYNKHGSYLSYFKFLPDYTTWSGSAWDLGTPNSSKNAVIDGDYTIGIHDAGANLVTKNLTVNSGKTLTVNPSKTLTINGNYNNNGIMTIKSDATGDGSMLVSGTSGGTGTSHIERYIASNKWHLVTSPITNGLSGVFINLYLRPYVESGDTFGIYITPTNQQLNTGKGYSLWANANSTPVFTGIPNYGNIGPISIPRTLNGYNLVGNPYPSAIDWDATSGWTKTNLTSTIYVWNPVAANYATHTYYGANTNGGSRYIAMGQGFFVQSNIGGGSLTMNNSVRVHNSIAFQKESKIMDNEIDIRIECNVNTYSDENVIVLNNLATDNFDSDFDAMKFAGDNNAPMLYTIKDNKNLAVANLSDINKIYNRDVYFQPGVDGSYTLYFNHSLVSDDVVLLDKKAQKIITNGQSYNFTANKTDDIDRFVISPATITSINESSEIQLQAYTYNNTLYVIAKNQLLNSVILYTLQGSKILETNNSIIDISSLASGIYLVNVQTDKELLSKKIIIQ